MYFGAPIIQSHNVVLVQDMSKRTCDGNLLVLRQLLEILHGKLAISEASLRKRIKLLPRPKIMSVPDLALMNQLRGLGTVKGKASSVTLISLHTITKALTGYGQLQGVVDTLQQLKSVKKDTAGPAFNQNTMILEPPATMQGAPVLPAAPQLPASSSQPQLIMPPPSTLFYPYTTGFPDNLPEVQPSSYQLKERYGLCHRYKNKLPNCMPVTQQMGAYKTWCMAKMNFSREDSAINSTTWADHHNTLSLYLGYCQLYQHVPVEAMSLQLFSNHMLLISWLAFCKARSKNSQHMTNTISHIKKVLRWLKAKDPQALADAKKVRPLTAGMS